VWIHCDKDMVGKKITRIKNHLLNLEWLGWLAEPKSSYSAQQ
jgi:hypothetical protein